jgi:hypothetical protein
MVNSFISNKDLDTDAPHQTGKMAPDRIFVSQRLERKSDGAILSDVGTSQVPRQPATFDPQKVAECVVPRPL